MVAVLLDADQVFAYLPGDEGDAWTGTQIGVYKVGEKEMKERHWEGHTLTRMEI